MAKLDELKQEAQELGITFSPNIGEAKLQEKIDEYYKSQETSSKQLQKAIKEKENNSNNSSDSGNNDKELQWRKKVLEAEEKARKTRIVEITDNDQRENNHTTTVTVTCGNQFFELGSRILPLNIPIEVEQGFIDVLKEIKIPMHSKRNNGQSVTVIRNRYSINYRDDLKKADVDK